MQDLNTPDQIRAFIKAQRHALSATQIKQLSTAIGQQLLASAIYQQAQNIACYYPVNGEVDPSIIVDDAWSENKKVFLPIIHSENSLLFAPYKAQSTMQTNCFGIPEPVCEPASYITVTGIDLLITPIVAFDSKCNRLGMGGGYYDRTLAGTEGKAPVKIGLAYGFQQNPGIRAQSWDIAMDIVITEHGMHTRKKHISPNKSDEE